jgi:hypothetical protein
MLDGVGSEINNIVKCKKLRDGTHMVAGQAYEGNCWTNYNKLYYDAWWSPISLAFGTNETWDTAGGQGGDDALFDFTQLNNGNLVFIGNRAFSSQAVWTFVTDSTEKKLLWEKVTQITHKTKYVGSARGLSVCATPDGGFTVAGEVAFHDSLGGKNALAIHFIPKPKSSTEPSLGPERKITADFKSGIHGCRLVVSHHGSVKSLNEVSLFDPAGRCVARGTGGEEIMINMAVLARGPHIARLKTHEGEFTKKVLY